MNVRITYGGLKELEFNQWIWCRQNSFYNLLIRDAFKKKITTDLVNMVLSPFTPLPSMGLVNKILVKIGEVFTPPISCQDRED